jgi:hypothetical protein
MWSRNTLIITCPSGLVVVAQFTDDGDSWTVDLDESLAFTEQDEAHFTKEFISFIAEHELHERPGVAIVGAFRAYHNPT